MDEEWLIRLEEQFGSRLRIALLEVYNEGYQDAEKHRALGRGLGKLFLAGVVETPKESLCGSCENFPCVAHSGPLPKGSIVRDCKAYLSSAGTKGQNGTQGEPASRSSREGSFFRHETLPVKPADGNNEDGSRGMLTKQEVNNWIDNLLVRRQKKCYHPSGQEQCDCLLESGYCPGYCADIVVLMQVRNDTMKAPKDLIKTPPKDWRDVK